MNPLKSLLTASLSLLMAAAPTLSARAAESQEPIITFHTTVYESAQEANIFHFYLGATEPTYVDVDCGFGPIEVEVGVANFDPEIGGLAGTAISCTVSEEGIVKVYGDPSKIDYIDLEGCYITDLQFPQLTNVEVLSLNHNELRSLNLSHMTKLIALYISDNPFSESAFVLGPNKPDLAIVDMSIIGNLDPSFNLADYPAMRSFQCWNVPTLTQLDPTACTGLLQLSIDNTNVSSLDLSGCPNLLILNVNNTKITELDLTPCPYLTELYCGHNADFNRNYKMSTIDVSMLPELQRFTCNGNSLTSLNIMNNPKLLNFNCSWNQLTGINLSNNPNLVTVDVAYNYLDFATLPSPRESWNEYWYAQRPLSVDRSYPVGASIDLASKVLRPGTVTQAFLFTVNEESPSDPVMLDPSAYTYNNGILTLNEVRADSVFITYINSELQEYPLSTSKFMVKSAADYGKDNVAAKLQFYPLVNDIALSIGIQGATPESPKSFKVDFGDGSLKEFSTTTHLTPLVANATGQRKGVVTIYLPEGTDLSALAVDGQRLVSVDLSMSPTIDELSITDCQLPSISLARNRCLRYLNLSGNNLTSVDFTDCPQGYDKTVIETVNLSRNRLSSFDISLRLSLVNLDLSDNRFEQYDLTKFTNLQSVNLADNLLTEVDLRDLESCSQLNLSGNRLTSIALPDYLPLTELNLAGNSFSLTTLPLPGMCDTYVYAPQRPVELPAKAPTVNLSRNYLDLNGEVTAYSWTKADGTPVAAGDITGTEGRFRFVNTELGSVICSMSHPAFPDFAGENILKTTPVVAAGMPTHVFATFTTTEANDGSIILAAAQPNTGIYIDWQDNQDLEQYTLMTEYTVFPATSTPGKTVRCYSYDANDGVTVFSLNDIKLSSIDVSPMAAVSTLTISNAGLTVDQITLPERSRLRELSLDGNQIDHFDLTDLQNLVMLNLNSNLLTEFDSTPLSSATNLYLAYNNLTSVTLNNPLMWECALSANALTSVDLSKLPMLRQLHLSQNELTELNIDHNPELRTLFIDHNRFTFATLPEIYNLYQCVYADQAPLEVTVNDGIVDLSAQSSYLTAPTTYRWFIDSPYFDEDGNLTGEELILGKEYILSNGVTTFAKPFDHIMCVMTNELAPSLYLYTDFLDVTACSALDTIEADDASTLPARWYRLDGTLAASTAAGETPSLPAGIYVRLTSAGATKVLVK